MSAYLTGNTNHHTEQNFEKLARCIMEYVTPNTRIKLMATYEDYKINGDVCGEVFLNIATAAITTTAAVPPVVTQLKFNRNPG